MTDPLYKAMTDWLVTLGIADMPHTGKTYLGHLIAVHRLMLDAGCSLDACRAGMFHSLYSTEEFDRFRVPLERRSEIAAIVGERAERLARIEQLFAAAEPGTAGSGNAAS